MKRTFVLLLFLLLTDFAGAAVVVDNPDARIFFGDEVQYYVDQNDLKFTEVAKQKTGWQDSPFNSMSFGFVKSACWIRFDLENRVGRELFLTFNVINNDLIHLYIVNNDGTYIEKTGGSRFPFSHREVNDKNIFFRIPEFKGIKTIYACFVSDYLINITPEIITGDQKSERMINEYFSDVFIFGIFSALFIYHLILFVSSGEKIYLSLILLIGAFQLYDLGHNGLGYMFLWRDRIYLENRIMPLSVGLIGVTSGYFIHLSLETKKHFRTCYWLLNFCIFSGFLLCLITFAGEKRLSISYTLLYAVINILITLSILFYAGVIRKNRSAFFIFLACLLVEAGNAVAISASSSVMIKHIPFLNDYYFILTFGKFSRVVFILVFSFVLADKINMMKKNLVTGEETYRSIFNGTSEAICILDKEEFTVSDANRAALNLFKPGYNDATEKQQLDYFTSVEDGYTSERAKEIFASVLNDCSVQTEWIFKTGAGEKLWADVTVNKVLINGGQRLMLVIRDISERKKVEEEKEKIIQQLIQAQKMEAVGSLAGGLAHDFNNILTGILGSSNIAKVYLDRVPLEKEKIVRYLDIVENMSVKASGMVKQLLTITRKHELKFVSSNLNTILKSVVEICSNSFPKSITIETAYMDRPAMVNADITGLEQVFLNILVNASHAVTVMRDPSESEGGVISLKMGAQYADDIFCRTHQDAVKGVNYFSVSIQDNGCGIDHDILDKIFNPFFTTKGETIGSGLGLSMVYTIINRHKGVVNVYSEKGKGATFTIYLPEDIGSKTADAEIREEIIKWHGRILIIDDEDVVRDIAGDILEDIGYDVVSASDGAQGIEVFKQDPAGIDLVLLDISMPGLSGFDTLRELKKIRPDVKVIMTSGFGRDKRVKESIDLGADDFIQKPYTNIELSKIVYDVIVSQNR